jgi:hypothetical protein
MSFNVAAWQSKAPWMDEFTLSYDPSGRLSKFPCIFQQKRPEVFGPTS